MISAARLLGLTKAVAAIACIIGVLLLLLGIVSSLSLAVPIFTGEAGHDALVLVFICVPLVQIALVIRGSWREESNPVTASKLYALTLVPLALLAAIIALVWTA